MLLEGVIKNGDGECHPIFKKSWVSVKSVTQRLLASFNVGEREYEVDIPLKTADKSATPPKKNPVPNTRVTRSRVTSMQDA
jgi:hypothetical protein